MWSRNNRNENLVRIQYGPMIYVVAGWNGLAPILPTRTIVAGKLQFATESKFGDSLSYGSPQIYLNNKLKTSPSTLRNRNSRRGTRMHSARSLAQFFFCCLHQSLAICTPVNFSISFVDPVNHKWHYNEMRAHVCAHSVSSAIISSFVCSLRTAHNVLESVICFSNLPQFVGRTSHSGGETLHGPQSG